MAHYDDVGRELPRVHVGRVNSVHRLRECFAAGIESVDGTGWMRDESRKDKMDALKTGSPKHTATTIGSLQWNNRHD